MKITTKLEHKDQIVLALTIILVLFLGLLYYIQKRTPNIINYPNDRTEIVAFGDSLIEGVGSSNNKGFIDDLEVILNTEIVNLGVSGNTTRDGLLRIDDITDRNARIVLISLGGNDFIQRIPEETVRKNLDKIVSKIQNDGAMVMVLGVPGYRGLYKDVSRDHQTAYVSNILSGLIGKDKYMSDLIHPNDLGYRAVAEKIAPELKKFIE